MYYPLYTSDLVLLILAQESMVIPKYPYVNWDGKWEVTGRELRMIPSLLTLKRKFYTWLCTSGYEKD